MIICIAFVIITGRQCLLVRLLSKTYFRFNSQLRDEKKNEVVIEDYSIKIMFLIHVFSCKLCLYQLSFVLITSVVT